MFILSDKCKMYKKIAMGYYVYFECTRNPEHLRVAREMGLMYNKRREQEKAIWDSLGQTETFDMNLEIFERILDGEDI